jgi:hypothetical protein
MQGEMCGINKNTTISQILMLAPLNVSSVRIYFFCLNEHSFPASFCIGNLALSFSVSSLPIPYNCMGTMVGRVRNPSRKTRDGTPPCCKTNISHPDFPRLHLSQVHKFKNNMYSQSLLSLGIWFPGDHF